jgi:hypothetical protein
VKFNERDFVEHIKLPGVIWQIFEKTQIDTVTLNLWYAPEGYEPPSGLKFLFEVLKSGEVTDQLELCPTNEMLVLAITRDRTG